MNHAPAQGFEASFARWVLSHRVLIIIITLVTFAGLAYGTKYLALNTSYRVFFSADNPELLAFEAVEDTYVKDDNVIFVLAPKNGDVFTPTNLAAIEKLTADAWQIPHSNRVDSITNFQFTEAEADDLVVRDMVKNGIALKSKELDKIRRATLAEPALNKRLISPTGHVAGINITTQLPAEARAKAAQVIAQFVRDMATDFHQENPDIAVYLTGMIMMDHAFYESSMRDSTVLIPISFASMILLIALLVGGVFGTMTTVLIIVFSIVGAMGVSGYIGFPLTGVSSAAPIIILTVAVANTIHLLVTFKQEYAGGRDKHEAMAESLRVNLQPVFLASATTAIGFLSMNFSEVPPFNHLGTTVSVGVLLSFVLAVMFLPALMSLLPLRRSRFRHDRHTLMDRFAEFVIKRRKQLLIFTTIAIIAAVANLPRNELNDVFLHYFDRSITFRTASDFMVDNLTGIDFINYSVDSGESGGISEPAFQADVEKFATWLESQPETEHVDRFTNIMKRLNKNMHGDDESYYRLPQDRDLAAQYLLLYEMSLPYGLDLNNQINVDKSQTKITATVGVLSSREMIDFNHRALDWARTNNTSFANIDSAGVSLMFSYIGQRNIKAMIIGTTVALVLISGILILALRSPRLGFISLLPNLAPAAVGFGIWGIFVGEVGLSLSIVAGMTFGIVIDDTVHFLSKYLRARRENDLEAPEAVRYAFRTVGRALVITTIVLVIGFSVLATSSFEMNSGMGLMTASIITIALIVVFLMLPPLLMKIEEKSTNA